MARATPARLASLEVLRRVRAGELADVALASATADLPPRDRAWAHEAAYGALRLRGRLDHVLDQLVKGGISRLEPDVLDVLRLGAYQLLEMSGVTSYAAVSESVELARAAGAARATGLVNGVLRALGRRRASLGFPDPETEPAAYLATWGSHPRWLVERWLERWGYEATRALVEANNSRPDLYVRVLGDAASAAAALAELEIQAQPVPYAEDSLRIGEAANVAQVLTAIPAVVQDPAASLVVQFADVPPGSVVADLCAAPGGKALVASERAGRVIAADVSRLRLGRLRENIGRLALESRVIPLLADARQPPLQGIDVVLLDAPCTGTGTFRRHPDGRWRVSPADLRALATLQREMLDAAAAVVVPGGLLIYSTCSLEPEENELQVDGFLVRHPDYDREPPDESVTDSMVTPAGDLLVVPQEWGADGSYAARLRKRA